MYRLINRKTWSALSPGFSFFDGSRISRLSGQHRVWIHIQLLAKLGLAFRYIIGKPAKSIYWVLYLVGQALKWILDIQPYPRSEIHLTLLHHTIIKKTRFVKYPHDLGKVEAVEDGGRGGRQEAHRRVRLQVRWGHPRGGQIQKDQEGWNQGVLCQGEIFCIIFYMYIYIYIGMLKLQGGFFLYSNSPDTTSACPQVSFGYLLWK